MTKEKATSEVTDKRNERQTPKPVQATARPTKHVHDMLMESSLSVRHVHAVFTVYIVHYSYV